MGNDLRSAIEGAMASGKVEAPAAPAAAPVTPAAPAAPPAAAPASTPPASVQRDESGRFKGGTTELAAVVASPATVDGAPKPTPPRNVKPPAAWTPAAREKWSTLPEDLQDEIARTERAATARIQQAAAAEKRWSAMQETIRPYEGMMRVAGTDPAQVIDQALRTVATLRSGTPAEKARLVAQMVADHGIGVDELDRTLAERLGGQPGAQPEAPKPAEFRDPRFDAFMSQMQQRERARTTQAVSDFAAKHEFFADVQDTVAGLLEAGVAKDLPSAYDAALKLHPEISGVLEQRKAAEAARTGNAAIERSAQAASSVRASPVSAGAPAPSGLRAHLEAAMRGG